jgi:hypothetical protein
MNVDWMDINTPVTWNDSPFDFANKSFTFDDDECAEEEVPDDEELISTISFSKSRMEKLADSSLCTVFDDDLG